MEDRKFRNGYYILDLSTEYLHLVRNVLKESIKNGNLWLYFGDELADGDYEEKTKWSDFHVSVPILFNFYHGLELLLKGFLLLKESYVLKASHKIEKLFKDFQKNYGERAKLVSVLDKYFTMKSMPKFLAECLRDNNVRVENLYEFFRYPLDKEFQNQRNYSRVRYKEKEGLSFFKDLVEDAYVLLKETVELYRQIEKKESLT